MIYKINLMTDILKLAIVEKAETLISCVKTV